MAAPGKFGSENLSDSNILSFAANFFWKKFIVNIISFGSTLFFSRSEGSLKNGTEKMA